MNEMEVKGPHPNGFFFYPRVSVCIRGSKRFSRGGVWLI
jgi:hypothetical protein